MRANGVNLVNMGLNPGKTLACRAQPVQIAVSKVRHQIKHAQSVQRDTTTLFLAPLNAASAHQASNAMTRAYLKGTTVQWELML